MYTLYSFAPNANKSVDEKPKHDERYRKESKKLEQVYIVWLYSHTHTGSVVIRRIFTPINSLAMSGITFAIRFLS